MQRIFTIILVLTVSGSAIFYGCNDDDRRSLNVFRVEDDIELGEDLHQQIKEDEQYDILDRNEYPEAYEHLDRIGETILNSGEVNYKDRFDWQFHIIEDDEMLNAFAAPGGYLYFYTGLIHYLEAEYEFAGVFGHEIAHADLRHSTERLTRAYGVSTLLDVLLGQDRTVLADIAAQIAFLSYSRSQESEADDYSVIYLNPTEYDGRGAARFFEKLKEEEQAGGGPQFLSSHPSPDNRVDEIQKKWEELGSQEGDTFEDRYRDFQNSLP